MADKSGYFVGDGYKNTYQRRKTFTHANMSEIFSHSRV